MTATADAPDFAPLTRWGHLWRLLVASIPLVVTLASKVTTPEADPRSAGLFLTDVALGAVAVACTPLHRRFALTFAFSTALALLLSPSSMGAGALGLVSIATRRRWRVIIPLTLLGVAASVANSGLSIEVPYTPWWISVIANTVAACILVLWGALLGTRRELVATLQWRAETAEREQASRVAAAKEAERARIAREMHDVLAHRISLLSMHAGVLGYRGDLTPDEVRAEAGVIQTAAKDALDELRGILGVLRDVEGRASARAGGVAPPQPTLAELDALLDEARAGGADVELSDALHGGREAVPPGLGRHVYRMVQEALTNARKHAPGAPVSVRLHGRAGASIGVEVRNAAPSYRPVGAAPGSRLGLIGLTERATIVGGSLAHGPTADGGYRVTATLPWKEQADER